MKKIKRIFFAIVIFVGCSAISQAQSILSAKDLSQTKVDDYSDDDIRSLYLRINEMGLTETQLYKIAEDKGLAAGEVLKLRSRLEQVNSVNSNKDISPAEEGYVKNNRSPSPGNESLPMQPFAKDSLIFGSELFTASSQVFEPNLRIPAPPGYILGPDDQIIVVVYGQSEKTYTLTINEEGNIYIPNVGPMFISGLSMEQATEKIRNKLANSIYTAIKSGQTKVQISLGKIRSIRVTVIGEARKPGTYLVSSLTTLYNMLYLCGGPTAMGTFRAIEIIRGNEVKRKADLYEFLTKGKQQDNVLLQEGDVVRIPYYKNRVTITGEVKRQGKFELLDGQTFKDLLEYTGGFNDDAYRATVSVIRITDKERKIIDLSAADYQNFIANSSDIYSVGKLLLQFENRIMLTGSVIRPGSYQLTGNMTIKNLLEKAGGIAPDAYTNRVSIFRYYQNKLPTVLSVNLDSVLRNETDLALIKDDSIHIHSIFEYKDLSYITLEGNVRNPGKVAWRENLTLRDVLLSNGGFADAGDTASIEVSRRLKNADVTKPDYVQSNIFNVNLSDIANASRDLVLQPYDVIMVKSIPGYTVQRMVLVQGEVLTPGRYALQKSGDRISDIFTRLGGFRSTADSTALTIRRSIKTNLTFEERERIFTRILNVSSDSINSNMRLRNDIYKNYDLISVNLQEALTNPGGTSDLLLEEGDVINIDRNSSLVKISGEVYYPTMIPYRKNTNLKYYIKLAGSYTSAARKSGAMVVYPDGRAKSVKRFLFFKSYPSVKPRSEIFVPQKLPHNRSRLGTAEWAVIVSTLGIIVTLIKTAFP